MLRWRPDSNGRRRKCFTFDFSLVIVISMDAQILPAIAVLFIGRNFKSLEFEEQAYVRQLMRAGLLRIFNGVVFKAKEAK